MTQSLYSVQSVVAGLKGALHQYLEAQYHIWDESLIGERKRLFSEPGATFQAPALEATPFYVTSGQYRELQIPSEAAALLDACSGFSGIGVFPRPFKHQTEAIEWFVGKARDIIVATGTGSGKTESFLLPLLASLALETSQSRESASMRGCRALLLYPMNALVNDQLSRLRRLFGDERVAALLAKRRGRNVQFGVYTGRTTYPGPRSKERDKSRLAPMFAQLFTNASDDIKKRLHDEGKWPAKDMELFHKQGYTTGPDDRELFTRHEMQTTCPDILVTNYSMLEYMLVRPIERSIFDQTKNWLHQNQQNSLTVILDEAHMYRGAAGAEVALLLRRLQSRLEVDRTRLKYILTSASLGSSKEDEEKVLEFASELTGLSKPSKPFVLITGKADVPTDGRPALPPEIGILAAFEFATIHTIHSNFAGTLATIQSLLRALGCGALDPVPASIEQLQDGLFTRLSAFPPARLLAEQITGKPSTFSTVAMRIFPDSELSERALESLLALASFARRLVDQRVFLPVRLHMFFRGVSGIYACVNPQCSEKRGKNRGLLGRLYSEPRLRCACGGRVYELLTHRDCGAAFIRGYLRGLDGDFLWHELGLMPERRQPNLLEAHLLVEPERLHATDAAKAWLHIATGRLSRTDPQNPAFLPIYLATSMANVQNRKILSFDKECPVCLRGWAGGDTKIMDLATKGDAPFAHLVKTQVKLQPPTKVESPQFPNGGRKCLLFSDGRQKAARLARDIPREVEQDVFRQVLVLAVKELQLIKREARLDGQYIYTAFLHVLAQHNLRLFDGEDHTHLMQHIAEYMRNSYEGLDEALDDRFSRQLPARFQERLLRQLGSPFYSLSALTLAVTIPTARATRGLQEALKPMSLSDEEIDAISISWIQSFLDKMAFDETFADGVRVNARGFRGGDWGIVPGKL